LRTFAAERAQQFLAGLVAVEVHTVTIPRYAPGSAMLTHGLCICG
jgi:hypothetical protein